MRAMLTETLTSFTTLSKLVETDKRSSSSSNAGAIIDLPVSRRN